MTTRLYYMDSYVTRFEATVLDVVEYEMQPALILDKTHFYPTSGGQLYDMGVLAALPVINVVSIDGTIYHVLADEPAHPLIGQSVMGNIDWSRRYDHMQQHSGQHLLSQTFYECFGHETVSVHFGDLEATLDLDTHSLTDEELSEVERFANHILEVVVTIDIQKLTHTVSIVMKFLHFKIQAHASTENLDSIFRIGT